MSTVAFFPEGAYGPTNNCVGIGDVLRGRGHNVVFIVEESFAGTLEAQGFEERLMRLGPKPEVEEAPGQFWKDFIRDTAPVFRTPTIEQLETFIAPTMQALIDGARYADGRLREIFDELAPDAIVQDNVCAFPALPACGRPWVRIVSCNPAEIRDADVPPLFSGYPVADRSGWDAYWAEFARTHADMHASFSEFCRERGAPALPDGEFMHVSPDANLYLYPSEVDYARATAPDGWTNLQASVRTTDAAWALPEALAERDGPLVYLSLGSLGSADVALMRKLIDSLASSRFRVIVSHGTPARRAHAGGQHDRRRVPPAGLDPPAGGRGGHPRRQQHGDRVPARRQADGPAAAVLGPVRQRPAHARDGLRRAAAHLHPRAGAADRRARGTAGRRRARRAPSIRLGAPARHTRHGDRGGRDRTRRGRRIPNMIPDSHRDLLDAQFATLATLGADGGPQLTEVWFLHEDGELKISLNTSRLKTKNLRKRPQCSLFLLDVSNPYRYVDVRGRARLDPDDDYTFADKVGAKYGGPTCATTTARATRAWSSRSSRTTCSRWTWAPSGARR